MAHLQETREGFWQTQLWVGSEPKVERETTEDSGDEENLQAVLRRSYRPRLSWRSETIVAQFEFGEIQERVTDFLRSLGDELTCFSNTSATDKLHRRRVYTLVTPEKLGTDLLRETLAVYDTNTIRDDQFGWWYASSPPADRQFLGTLDDAVAHFRRHSLIVERGPQWRNLFMHDEILPLHIMRSVMTVKDTERLNDALNRGWYLLGLEFDGDTTDQGELLRREARYVVGHIEENVR